MESVQILVTNPFPERLLDKLRAVSPAFTVERAAPEDAPYERADILYTHTPPRDLSRLPRLQWVQLHLAGVDMLADHPIYRESAIPLATTSGVHAASAGEYAFTALLALAHRVPRLLEWQSRGGWPPDADRWNLFVPSEVRGASIGIIGYGSLGREVGRLAKAFGMRVLVSKRDTSRRVDEGYRLPGTGDPEGVLPDAWFPPGRVRDLLAESDYVVLCAPLTPETRGMLGAAEIAAMKPGAYFVNVGRGATVDEAALAQALAERRIGGAGIDVFAQEPPPAGHPFYALDNVILSPHVSGFIPSYDEKCTDLFAENLRRWLDGKPLFNLVDRTKGY